MKDNLIKSFSVAFDKEVIPFVEKNGIYGVAIVALFLMHDLAEKSMNNGYEIDWDLKNGRLITTRPKGEKIA